MSCTFDEYLEKQLKDPAFAARFEEAGKAWDMAVQIESLGYSEEDSLVGAASPPRKGERGL